MAGKVNPQAQRSFEKSGMDSTPKDRAPVLGGSTPYNCKNPCPYGHGRTFCWPCYKKIVEKSRMKRGAYSM
ncbi:hypothetical protein [Butyrivibrio sp. INlla14]|uniref:hypothetical protein n=1 Tax=Butyrivibrio sp. INlla14 TaxID=1520808 RepID=UPI0008764455|nr:hypothetical protein [Butyrivibrio sp. INlla14]SCY63283.1 hypothetical protein SAMN02910371_03132 [Butyrivibrio sp. INlla14]